MVLLALTLLVAATRFPALSKTLWDWDEGLFCLALRDYDVVAHHPHPPGFPLFIAAAKLVRLVVHDDFLALRTVSLLSALFVFPALYLLARALRCSFRTSVLAALLLSFLPNVWFWGGTAFSDVFALVLFLFAATFLFRGDRYLLGGVFFAATLLVRPQNVLLAYPWFVASWRRIRAGRVRDVVLSAAIITALVLGGYALAARATGGFTRYIQATRAHQRYVATIDGALNPIRPPLMKVLRDFAVDPFLAGRASYVLALFAAAAFLRPKRRHLDVVLTFAPNFVLAWLMLSVTGVSRLSLGYIPMHALLAADGIAVVAALIARGRARIVPALEVAFAAAIILRYVYWAWPALTEARTQDAPPVAAVRWIQQHVPRTGSKIYVQGGMVPFTDYYLGGWPQQEAEATFDPLTAPEEPGAYFIADGPHRSPRAINFRRSHRHLWGIFLRRYFESSVTPVAGGPHPIYGTVQFADGWYLAEGDPADAFRWMGRRGRMVLAPLPRPGQLSLNLYVPIDVEPPPNVTVIFNGVTVDHFLATEANTRKTYALDATKGEGEVVFTVDRAINPSRLHPGGDARDLGLRVNRVVWRAILP